MPSNQYSFLLVLARAIHSLAKIGEDLYIDPSESGLAIRTANGTKSAFVSYSFKTSFFSSYSLISAQNTNHTRNDISTSTQLSKHGNNENINGSGDDSKCRVTMRASKFFATTWHKILLQIHVQKSKIFISLLGNNDCIQIYWSIRENRRIMLNCCLPSIK